MAVVTLWMALDSIYTAPTATGRITFPGRSPTMTARYPADLRFAHGTFEPIAAPFLHHYYLTRGAVKRFTLLDHLLQHCFGPSRF